MNIFILFLILNGAKLSFGNECVKWDGVVKRISANLAHAIPNSWDKRR